MSELPKQMRGGTLTALYRATNAIIVGDRLSEKIGARIGANITLQTSQGARITAQVVGFFHTGVRQIDEGTAYVLTKTGQILAQQTGLINELRITARRSAAGARNRRAHRERHRLQVGVVAGGLRGPALDLHHPQHHHVCGGRRHPAGGELRHLQHHLHHHPREGARHRDHEVARLARVHRAHDFRGRGADHRAGRRARRLRVRLSALRRRSARSGSPIRSSIPTTCRSPTPTCTICWPAWWRWCPRSSPAISRRARPRAAIRSRSSGARHERDRDAKRAKRSRDAADRGAQRHPHPARHRADHAGARHQLAHRRQRVRRRSPGRPARANPRCSICSACSTCRPRARC